jgi:tetratricopeptide (TPR) repeat protein
MHGLTVMVNGQLDEAERYYGIVLGAYDPARDAALRFAFGSD